MLRHLFEAVVETRIAAGLVGGEAFSLDASLIRADVNQSKRLLGEQAVTLLDWERASRAVLDCFTVLDREGKDEEPDAGGREKKPTKAVSLTDSQAQCVGRQRMRAIARFRPVHPPP